MTDPADVTVLIADDEQELVELYAPYLQSAYTVHTATNGKEALEKVIVSSLLLASLHATYRFEVLAG